jgi:hypothetical protein
MSDVGASNIEPCGSVTRGLASYVGKRHGQPLSALQFVLRSGNHYEACIRSARRGTVPMTTLRYVEFICIWKN